MNLQFAFENLTIGDALLIMKAATDNDQHTFLSLADRYTIGGVMHLPVQQLADVAQQFAIAFVAKVNAPAEPISADVARLLRQALGHGGEDK